MIAGVERILVDLYDPGRGGFRFSHGGHVTLLSTCFGVMLAYLLRQSLPDRERTCVFVQECQRPDGLFVDPLCQRKDLRGSHSEEYLHWQGTFFSLIALDMLGGLPRHPLRFLAPFVDPDVCRAWYGHRDWNNFWYCSNEIMFLLYFMTFAQHCGALEGPWRQRVHDLFDLLDTSQDDQTGYWGEAVRVQAANGMYGAAHIYLFYDFYDRPVRHAGAVIRQTLALQGADGLFAAGGGGACEDYDGVEILVRMMGREPAKDGETRAALCRCRDAILRNSTERANGFPYRFPAVGFRAAAGRWLNRAIGGNRYFYSGWRLMSCDVYSPDLWATYFRVLTMALVESTGACLAIHDFQSYPLPGWGYLVHRGQSTEEGS